MRGKKNLLVAAALAVFAAGALAQDVPVPAADDFRVAVRTNRDAYRFHDVLRLTVELLNDSPNVLHISRPEVITPLPENPDAGQVFRGRVDDDDVDVVIDPVCCPIIIGTATLRPLRPVPTLAGGFAPVPDWSIRLPLVGETVIQAHSTRVLSVAAIFIGHPPVVEPDPVEPQPAVEAGTTSDSAEALPDGVRERIEAMGRFVPIVPGEYILECNIDKIWGVKRAQAQKIIRIMPRRPIPVPVPATDWAKEHKEALERLREQHREFFELQQKILRYVQLNNRYLRAIAEFLMGKVTPDDPAVIERPTPVAKPLADGATTQDRVQQQDGTLDRTRLQDRTRANRR